MSAPRFVAVIRRFATGWRRSTGGRRMARSLITGCGAWLLLTLIFLSGALDRPRLGASDLLFGRVLWQARQSETGPAAASPIVLVAIDDKTLTAWRQYGRLTSWPRRLHATALRNILAGDPRSVAFDFLFDAPSADDAVFAAALNTASSSASPAPTTILGVQGTDQAPNAGPIPVFRQVDPPVAPLAQAATALAHVNVQPDADGSVRRVPPFVVAAGRRYPSLSLMATLAYLRRPADAGAPVSQHSVLVAGRRIPLDDSGAMLVNFGSLAALPQYSYVDVEEGNVPAAAFRDKMVFIGVTANALGDDYWTPASSGVQTPGVVIHAAAAATILNDQFLADEPPWATVLSMLVLSLAGAALVGQSGARGVAFGTLGLAALTVVAGYRAFDDGTLPDLFSPLLALGTTTLGALAVRVNTEQREQLALRRLLGAYLSPTVMRQVTQNAGAVTLGGEKRRVTILFADVRGFTAAGEHLEPTALVNLLNELFTALGDVIFANNGVIDKYVGDAIMAFWNAPIEQPEHASLACRAALAMQQEVDRLSRDWIARGMTPLHIGVGVNTGDVAVGNMGSRQRFTYTVIGDAVNVAARLESLTKQVGASILLGASTAEELPDSFVLRDLAMKTVPGRREPVHVYELREERAGVLEPAGSR